MRRPGIALIATLALTLTFGNVALADHVKAICEVTATASAKLEKGYVLNVRLRTADGKPVNEATVRFYEKVELFGDREMYIGSATTDGQGDTSFTYLPARLGTHEIVARSARKDHFIGSEGRTTFEATVAARAYRPEPAPLAAFSAAVPFGVGALVLAVWALLAFAILGTARGILRSGRDLAPQKEEGVS
ncbi:MAG TPA: hypothetical protein VGA16_08950 [Candidatus Limnocylindria bacterium]